MIDGHGGNVFALARQLGCREAQIIDMSSNINPLGPPPGLMDNLKNEMARIHMLPEVDSHDMTAKMGRFLGIEPGRLWAGSGPTQFIYTMVAALDSRQVLILGPTYADYADACAMVGIEPSFVLARAAADFQPDLDHLDQQITGFDTVVLCNPNNPTGALIPREDLDRLCRHHPDTRFIIDESYLSFVPEARAQSMTTDQPPNALVLHSLSKIYRLPGLRVGFLIGAPGLIQRFQSQIQPWSVNSLAQIAVDFLCRNSEAVNAFIQHSRQYIGDQRTFFYQRMAASRHLTLFPSTTSFILIQLGPSQTAAHVWAQLARERILIRNCDNFYGLDERFIRVAMNTSEINQMVADRLTALTETRA